MTIIEKLRRWSERDPHLEQGHPPDMKNADYCKLLNLYKTASDVDTIHFDGSGDSMKRMNSALRKLETEDD
jgi:hypothetical protein